MADQNIKTLHMEVNGVHTHTAAAVPHLFDLRRTGISRHNLLYGDRLDLPGMCKANCANDL